MLNDRPFDLSPAQWLHLRRLLDTALDLGPQERLAWLDALAGPDAEHAPRLRALLQHAGSPEAERLLWTLPKIETGEFAAAVPEGERQVGPYRLLRQIGEGGMASVWLAERTDLLQGRRVALKLPHGPWRGAAWAARLAREREILATLTHPNIARLYDAGIADDGQPYLVIEHVEGQSIDVHCRDRGLGVADRLRLFLQVARAVAHAHAKLVVHRDLKPSNILVTANGEVRLLDFGIAKLLEHGGRQHVALTQQGAPALTLQYASPEQVAGQVIGTASDVYSLGVVLHELLTGQQPYRLSRRSRAALEEAILAADPLRPSDTVTQRQQQRALRGDLDAIVLKALKKQPEQRYGTVEALADDVERHLEGLPVSARPDSNGYRFAKFVARNRLMAGAAAAVFAAVTLGGGLAAWQAHSALEEQRKAEDVKEFLASMLRDADPWEMRGKASSVSELLRQAHEHVETKFAGRPPLQVELLNLVGMGLLHHEDVPSAAAALTQAAKIAEQHLAADHAQRLRTHVYMSEIHLERGQPARARSELALALPALRARGTDSVDLVTALWNLSAALIDEGRYDDAVTAAREGDEFARSRLGERHPVTAGVAVMLALAHLYACQNDLALPAAERARRLTYAVYGQGAKRPQTIEANNIYARALAAAGKPRLGVEAMEQALSEATEFAGPSSIVVANLKAKLALLNVRFGQVRQALIHSEESLRVMEQYRQQNSVPASRALSARGAALLAARDPRAPDVLGDALRDLEGAFGAASHESLAARARLGLSLAQLGKTTEAQALLEPWVTRVRGNTHPSLGELLHALGVAKRLAGEHEAALDLQQEAATLFGVHAGTAVERARALTETGLSQLALGRHEQAAMNLQRALDVFKEQQAGTTPESADALVALGRLKLTAGAASAAEPLLREAHDFWRGIGADSRWARESARWLERCLAAQRTRVDAPLADARSGSQSTGRSGQK